MKIVLSGRGANHHNYAIEHFSKGLKVHGVPHQVIPYYDIPECDLLVGWGGSTIFGKENICQDYIMMEAAYLEPRITSNNWPLNISLGYNGLNGRADFLNKGKDGSRWEKNYNDGRLLPWTEQEDYILVTGQVLGDKSLRTVSVDYTKIIGTLKQHTDLPIVFKPHPKGTGVSPPGCTIDTRPLTILLKKAKAVVTINSNSGVDALVYGVPVLALDEGAMYWDVALKQFTELTGKIKTFDRTAWLHELSWCQWFPEEIASGESWEHLKTKYD